MVRTIVYFFVAVVVLGTIATPGLGAFALVLVPLLGLGFLWRVALTVSTDGRPVDSFAASPLAVDEYRAEASARASASARNGFVRGANVPRPRLSETLPQRPRGENSIQEGRR
jgi:hypothetical protein